MTDRYAIYYAPPRTSRLWKLAAQWLGRDAATSTRLEPPVFKHIEVADFLAATESPRRYGFHATLKPPMRLGAGVDAARLEAVARSLTAGLSPVSIGRLEVRELEGFVALMPVTQRPELTRFAADCVTYFEPLRAALEPEEETRRRHPGLTGAQQALLDTYGYPYVMDEFRMHMTLTGRLHETARKRYLKAAKKWFAPALEDGLMLNTISIFHEPGPGQPFRRMADFEFFGDA